MQHNTAGLHQIEVKAAKGRPMLTWVGKRPLHRVPTYPAQHIETIASTQVESNEKWDEWPERYPKGGLLFYGDNKEVLAHLLANGFRGRVKLVYIDPPFDSGASYVRKVRLRGVTGISQLDGDSYSPIEQIQYRDIWGKDTYLQFIYERLILLKELLSEDGSLWLHCDYHKSHYLKCICDEVFGETNFLSEVVWNRAAPRGNVRRGFSVAHDTILAYSQSESLEWHPPSLEYSDDYIARFTKTTQDGRQYTTDNLNSPNPDRPNLDYVWNGVRRVWRVTKDKMREYERQGRLEYTSNGVARYIRYLDELEGRPLTTLWDDIFPVNSQANEREDYPTQKPESLLDRIIQTCTSKGDIVLDCFIGSGTTASVAQKLGRRWIGCDINKGSVQTTVKRLKTIIDQQSGSAEERSGDSESTILPAQYSFTVYRVNDYDLQIQHNEAVNLACEALGIQRINTDRFFDGVRGKQLAKIIPVTHPISIPDLEEVRRELDARADEIRDILVVGLGKDPAVDSWLDNWNRLRKRGDVPNKVEIVELRSDPNVGGFIQHVPASARISVVRDSGQLRVNVLDFVSPTIIQRLDLQGTPLGRPQISDWRAMVDSIMIDTAYNGESLNIHLADIPSNKMAMVSGEYELDAPDDTTLVAVKIIDMLGEEVLVVQEV
ncbi:MAG: site-specific DNA-methyltransferase [Caldilineaceae bacterium]|nr:site-specific DNA-methyltransferase [Caldilineaceae bacterium]